MELIHTRTNHVVGLPPERGGVGDPSPFTAAGVEAAMRACVGKRFGAEDFEGRSVAIVGAGSVGEGLARMLSRAGRAPDHRRHQRGQARAGRGAAARAGAIPRAR